jgi:uncharacterized protein (DUF58 family)
VTPAGWTLLSALVPTALIGLDTESSVAYQAFSLLFCLTLFALLGVLWFRARFDLDRSLPRFASAGEPFTYRVTIRNLTDKAQSGLTLLELLGEDRQVVDDTLRPFLPSRRGNSFRLTRPLGRLPLALAREQPVPPIPAHGSTTLSALVVPLRRGPLRFASARIARTDLLGLLRAFVIVERMQTVMVLPKRYPVPALELPGREQYQLGGIAQASAVGASEEFVSLRDYRRGDPLRHIHWRSWARVGEPIVKEFEDEFFVRHGLVLDTFDPPEDPEPFEEAVSVAASFACSVRTQESVLDLMFVGVRAFRFTVGRGLAHTNQLLEILACARPTPDARFDTLACLVLGHARSLSACVCVLLRWDATRQEFIRRLRLTGVPVRVIVVLGSEEEAELDPGPMSDCPECFLRLRAGHVAEDLNGLTGGVA